MPGADETGELADSGIAADILREAGGIPEAAEGDSAAEGQGTRDQSPGTKSRTAARTSKPAAEDIDETADVIDTETAAEAAEQDAEAAEETNEETGEAEGEETEGEASAESESQESPETPEDETPAWAQRRFSEYARKVERLEQQLAEAHRRLGGEGQPAVRTSPAELDVLAVETPEELAQVREQTERLEEWAELNRDGVEADPDKPNSRAYTAQEVAQVRINARRKLRAVQERAQQLEHTQRFNAAAAELYPGFKDSDSEENRAVSYILQRVPELRRLPNYRIIIGDALAGERSRARAQRETAQAKRTPGGKPLPGKPAPSAAVRRPPPVNGAPARGSAAPAGKSQVRAKARERAFQTGSEADIARLVEASLG